jgi:hypothetical protein
MMKSRKPGPAHIWRRWNAATCQAPAPIPHLTVRHGERIPYGRSEDDGLTILQSDERGNESMPH